MSATGAVPRDVFIAYSKGDPFESKLVEAIKDQLYNWGLTAWVYEDWDWEKESERGPRWRASGRMDQIDLVRYAMRHPEPFEYRPKGPQADREMIVWMFEHCGAIVVIAPRGGSLSAGTWIEIDVLRGPHPPVTSASWSQENERLVEDLQVFFDFRLPSPFPRDVSVAGESLARCAWLACMMARLAACGRVGWDLLRQLAGSDPLLNGIAQRLLRPLAVPLEPDPNRGAVLPHNATAEDCAPVLEFWLSGPAFTADQLTSGKPPSDIIAASKQMRSLLRDWCQQSQARFPTLAAPSAKISFPLGAAMLRIGKPRDATQELTRALAAPDARALRTSILLDRGLAWSELELPGKAVDDYTEVLADETLDRDTRAAVLLNRAIIWNDAGKYREAERDLDEILSMKPLSAPAAAPALVSRALVKIRTDRPEGAIADYDRIVGLKKAPVEAHVKALLNRGVLQARLKRFDAAIRDYDAVLDLRESTPYQRVLALFNRADAKSSRGDPDAAWIDYEAALEEPGLGEELKAEITRRLASLKGNSMPT